VPHFCPQPKSYPCWSIDKNDMNFTWIERESFWRNCNRRRVLVPIFLSVLKMFVRSPTDVISRTPQVIGTKQTMITIFFTGHTQIVLDILPNGCKFNQSYYVDSIFAIWKGEKWIFVVESRRRLFGYTRIIQRAIMRQKEHQMQEASCFMITAPTLFARHNPLRLLFLWSVKESLERLWI
jgi:hypothetical protein